MVLDFATVLESIFGALRATCSGCSTRSGGHVGSDGFLILSPATLEEGDAEGRQGQQFRTSRVAAPHHWHVQGVLGVAVDAQDGVVF
jgi:hypothetical protein